MIRRENKNLTATLVKAINGFEDANPGKVTVGEIVISLLAVWDIFWRRLPPYIGKGKPNGIDGTVGAVVGPPRVRDVVCA
jgi:hypothetical protein